MSMTEMEIRIIVSGVVVGLAILMFGWDRWLTHKEKMKKIEKGDES